MRLINCRTGLFEEFWGQEIPRYGILSHTWSNYEITFKDFYNMQVRLQHPESMNKINRVCAKALDDGNTYLWADNCCIDKSSSAELTEAINSMFKWYQKASRCYVHLSDFEIGDEHFEDGVFEAKLAKKDLKKCRWFERGWTLQELIAPGDVCFYDQNWDYFGTRTLLARILRDITKIPSELLDGSGNGLRYSVGQRMSWAADRKTTRAEDMAYCLFGLFDVNLPLLYGEGGQKAFIRLQEEMLKQRNDLTLLAWQTDNLGEYCSGILARSPNEFRNAGNVRDIDHYWKNPEFAMTNKGFKITTPLLRVQSNSIYLPLNCSKAKSSTSTPSARKSLFIRLIPLSGTDVHWRDSPQELPQLELSQHTLQTELVYIVGDGRALRPGMEMRQATLSPGWGAGRS